MAVVETRMNFLPPWDFDRENPYVRGVPSEGYAKSNFEQKEYSVNVTDARPQMGDFNLDTHAFAYHCDSSVYSDVLEAIRSNDIDRVKHGYLPLVERLVREKTGASRVVAFDHAVRRRAPDSTAKYDGEVKVNNAMQPAGLVRKARTCVEHQCFPDLTDLHNLTALSISNVGTTGSLRPVRKHLSCLTPSPTYTIVASD
jgi:hypothetical protein